MTLAAGAPEAFTKELKRTSALRRIPAQSSIRYIATPGLEGFACVVEMADDAEPLLVESASGRAMQIAPGDFFLATPGHRESTRWVVGAVPPGGLRPGEKYWVLSESGAIGDLIGDTPLAKHHVGQVKYHGAAVDDDGQILTLERFAMRADQKAADQDAPVYLILGTSAEVGKTTAGIAVLRTLRHADHSSIVAWKATGTSSLVEILRYQDFGAGPVFDCVDFGLPTTYPSGRGGIDALFNRGLDVVLSVECDAVMIECGGDIHGANVPVLLECLKRRRSNMTVILAAADALGALGSKRVLDDMGLAITLITGPCTDSPTLRQRTQELCGIPAVNLSQGGIEDLFAST